MHRRFRSTTPVAGFLLLILVVFARPTLADIAIERVVSPGGIEAWLVEDRKIPVIAMEFSFEGGSALDPDGKEGLGNLVSTLLDEGAGPHDSLEFQRRLRDNAINLSFDISRDGFFGSLKTLTENSGEAFALARLALSEPRFDAEAVERMRAAVMASIRRNQADPNFVARRAFFETVFPDHPYGKETAGTLETVSAITADDLRGFVRDRFARDTLTVAVTGDITPDELGRVLDEIFGVLPERAAPFTIADTEPEGAGEVVVVRRPIPQSVVLIGQEGVRRDDPDWFAASIMNYVLGGGGFTSRLMEEVREKRGLTYGIGSYLVPMDHAALIMAGAATVNVTAGRMLDIVREEWRRLGEEGISETELANAKTYLTGSFPLQFDSTSAVASILLQMQREDLGLDYLDKRNALIEAVTLDDVRRVARRLLDPSALATVVVGQPEGVEPTRTDDPNRS